MEITQVTDWMASITIEKEDLATSTIATGIFDGAWKTCGGYIERNGHAIGVLTARHDELLSGMREEHEEELNDHVIDHKKEMEDVKGIYEEAVRKEAVAQRARSSGQKKIIEQQQLIEQLRQQLADKDSLLVETTSQLQKQEGAHNLALEQRTKELRDVQRRHDILQQRNQEVEGDLNWGFQTIRYLRGQLSDEQAAHQQQYNELQQRVSAVVQARNVSIYNLQQEVNRLALVQHNAGTVEWSNYSQARQLRDLAKERSDLAHRAAKLAQRNHFLEARVVDLEGPAASNEGTTSPETEALIDENKRLVEQADNHRLQIAKHCSTIEEQSELIADLNGHNDVLFWRAADARGAANNLQDEVDHLRPLAGLVPTLQTQITALQTDLNTNWLSLSPSAGPFGQIIHKQYGQIQTLMHANTTLEARTTSITTAHAHCEEIRENLDITAELRETIIAALRKQINHTVAEYDRLRTQAGLEAVAPPAGCAGMQMVTLRAMFEKACAVHGYPLSEEMLAFAMEQDELTLREAEEVVARRGVEVSPYGRELTAFEKVAFSVVDNMKSRYEQLLAGKLGEMGRELHPMLRAVEDAEDAEAVVGTPMAKWRPEGILEPDGEGGNRGERDEEQKRPAMQLTAAEQELTPPGSPQFRFADTKSLLAEVRTESQSRDFAAE